MNDELEELLNKLQSIGKVKNELPFNARGWCNILGLFVQLKQGGGMARLQAGGKYHSQIDAWLHDSPGTEWKVEKYNPGDWEKLVNPTLDIACWLGIYGGLPKEQVDAFNDAIAVFWKEGNLKLPPC